MDPTATSDPALDGRVTDLEIRLAFMERTLEDLDGVVQQVAGQVERMRAALEELEGKVEAAASPAPNGEEALLYERPPHY